MQQNQSNVFNNDVNSFQNNASNRDINDEEDRNTSELLGHKVKSKAQSKILSNNSIKGSKYNKTNMGQNDFMNNDKNPSQLGNNFDINMNSNFPSNINNNSVHGSKYNIMNNTNNSKMMNMNNNSKMMNNNSKIMNMNQNSGMMNINNNSKIMNMNQNSGMMNMNNNSKMMNMNQNSGMMNMNNNSNMMNMNQNSGMMNMNNNSQIMNMNQNSGMMNMNNNSKIMNMNQNSGMMNMNNNSKIMNMGQNSGMMNMNNNSKMMNMNQNTNLNNINMNNNNNFFGNNNDILNNFDNEQNMNNNNIMNLNNNNMIMNQFQQQGMNQNINSSQFNNNNFNQSNPSLCLNPLNKINQVNSQHVSKIKTNSKIYQQSNNNDFSKKEEQEKTDILKKTQISIKHSLLLSKYYEYANPDEKQKALDELLADMSFFGDTTKREILKQKGDNPSKYIPIDEAIEKGNSNYVFFVLSILAKNLMNEGCIVAIERDQPSNENENHEHNTTVQFLVNGMYNFKKYIFHFDFGEEKNNELLNNNDEQVNFNRKLKIKLLSLLKVHRNDIIMCNPRNGSYEITAIIKKIILINYPKNNYIKNYQKIQHFHQLKK